ncbi:glycosyltransferase family 2 protein [Pseudodesulfovibrio sp.]|uniref:glycosyltransferase family 2 protein n=1 Tax=Pseudodesulfovibrio sp. TaxID=2035812 RepID=UPI0026149235|nr:glycosyltransferase family 2 protein [Pseudodesulfovibrio sp.]MDD3313866.1 glycosyltransferase family 2 protein [Pseudodesulfovibrio sp.]
MADAFKVAIIIPAFNEAPTIGGVVASACSLGHAVFVVDDSSCDATGKVAAEAGATVLRMPYQQGAWGAIQAGMRYALNLGYGLFITMDADGQHEPQHIATLIDAYRARNENLIIGSCPERGSKARKLAWCVFSMLTRLRAKDITSGFRLYDHRAAGVLLCNEASLLDYQDLGVLLLLRRHHMHFGEVAIPMRTRLVGHSRIFDTWLKVARYLATTMLWIFADWVSPPRRLSCRKQDDSL